MVDGSKEWSLPMYNTGSIGYPNGEHGSSVGRHRLRGGAPEVGGMLL